MTFEASGAGVLCRLTLEEAERAQREGYLSITPAEDGELSRAIRAEIDAQGNGEDFAAFWAAYPRKEGRKAAVKAWGSAKKRNALPAIGALLIYLQNQVAARGWPSPFTPHASTWLNGERWNDPAEAPPRPPAAHAVPPPEWAEAIMSPGEIYAWQLWDKEEKKMFLGNLSCERYRREAALREGEDE